MKSIAILLIIVPSLCFAQPDNRSDSSRYYTKEITAAYKRAIDSVENTPLYQGYKQYQVRRNNYNAMNIFFNALHSDYGTFNANIARSGFPAMKPMSYGFGLSSSGRYEHLMMEFGFSFAGTNSSKKDNETLRSTLLNILFDLGYDVLSSHSISVYPYAGLSLRMADLSYTIKGAAPATTDIPQVFMNSGNNNAFSSRLGYQAGLGVDVALAHAKEKKSSILFFVKGGLNQPFGKDRYKTQSGYRFDPGINKGDWMISAGFKFARRWGFGS